MKHCGSNQFMHYVCWAFSSSTDISRSFIWPRSSSSWALASSSGSSRALPLSELGAAAGLGLASAGRRGAGDGAWDKSPDSVLGLVGNKGSKSDFGLVGGPSPLCLQMKRGETFQHERTGLLRPPSCRQKHTAGLITRADAHLRFGEGASGLSGLFGRKPPGLPFPGGGTGFLGGTTGAAGLDGL
ncbi:hypothetical protein EYF80_004661 [Liparis tanakae]|uniref:Uncharacterized protein n=1 Tax=Liparis tanakae TaxID=230148 RepID=A0A4Z2J4R0_9TELE|nr:hypothetical protein EYF80_004661 [Liparis tanakae]